jgi:hypothetical protein
MQPPQGAGTGEVTSPTCPPGPPSLSEWLGAEGLGFHSGELEYLSEPVPPCPGSVVFQGAAERLLTLGGQRQEARLWIDLVHVVARRARPMRLTAILQP